MNIVNNILLSKKRRKIYFGDEWTIAITEDELTAIKETVLEEVTTLSQSDDPLDVERFNYFWDCLKFFCGELQWVIRFTNKKYWLSYDYNLNKAQKIFFNESRSHLSRIESRLKNEKAHINYLVFELCEIDSSFPITYYLDEENWSKSAEIGVKENGEISLVLADGLMEVFYNDRDKFDAIILHEVAHVKQKDTRFILREKFIEEGLLQKSYWSKSGLITGGFLIFVGLMMYNSNYFRLVDFSRIAGRRILLSVLVFFLLMRMVSWKRSSNDEKRYISELGADTYSLVQTKNLKLIELLVEHGEEYPSSKTKMHLSVEERVDQLKILLGYCLKAATQKIRKDKDQSEKAI